MISAPPAIELNDALDQLPDYPFARLNCLLATTRVDANRPPVLMSIGEPQQPPPALIDEILHASAHLWGKYPPVNGTEDFRAAVAGWLCRRYGLADRLVDPQTMILPVSGTREALFQVALLAVPRLRHGRAVPAVLIPNPFYAVYAGAAAMARAEPVFLSATPDTGFLPDLDALTPALLSRTALFYLCSPSNPQGAIADLAYLRRAIALARHYGFVLVADECYAEIYDRAAPPGLLEAADGDMTGLLVFNSLSKRSSAAGIRSGFVAGDPALIRAFATLRSYGLAGVPLPILAASAALWRDEAHVVESRDRYRARIDAAERALSGRLGFYRPPGGFFLWLDVGDGEAAAAKLWQQAAIKTLPGAYLARPDRDGNNVSARYLRIALVHEPEIIFENCALIAAILDPAPVRAQGPATSPGDQPR
ncbi:MAG: aminotransferase class I/II-fold pyridoxal phosphate-dependent enzyme [Azospirillaceae bacterium]|nr:aminotransferase class I/II-fold pyridoxal phosphate-dependent enzyme [Azospirillaceae bacterium]